MHSREVASSDILNQLLAETATLSNTAYPRGHVSSEEHTCNQRTSVFTITPEVV